MKTLKIWGIASVIITFLGFGATTYSFLHDIKQKTKSPTEQASSDALKVDAKDPTLDPYKIDFEKIEKNEAKSDTDALCNINDEFSCDKVARDKWSTVFGIPLGFYGFSYFIAGFVLLILTFICSSKSSCFVHSYFLMNLIALSVSLTLLLYSKFGLKVFCPSCIAIDSVVGIQLFCTILFWKSLPKWRPFKSSFWGAFCGGALATSIVVLVLGLYYAFGPRL